MYEVIDPMAKKEEENVATDDAVLQMLLTLADEDGFEFGVTLNIKGAVVSGTLIGPTAYYDGVYHSAEEIKDHTMSNILTKKFSDLRDAFKKSKEESKEKKEEDTTATFIHLRNAKYIGADGQPLHHNSTTWWRGRIESIDAFSFQL